MIKVRKIVLAVLLGFFAGETGNVRAQSKRPEIRRIDSLRALIAGDKEDTVKVNHLNALFTRYKNIGNYDSGFAVCTRALSLSQKLNFKKGMAAALGHFGSNYYNQGNYVAAQKYNAQSLALYTELGNKKSIANAYNSIGLVSIKTGNYPEALKNYLAALKIDEEIGSKDGMAICYNNLAGVYSAMGSYGEAQQNYLAAAKIFEQTRSSAGISSSYSGLGQIYAAQKNYAKASEYFWSALRISQASGDKKKVAGAYNNIAVMYHVQGDYVEAMKNHFESLKIKEEIGDKTGTAFSHINIGFICIELKKQAEAKMHFSKAFNVAVETGNLESISYSYRGFSQVDSLAGDFKSALQNYKTYVLYRDSLINEDNTKKAVQAQMQYDFDKKSSADSIKNAETKRIDEINHQSQIRSQKLYTYAGLGGFLIMIVIAAISFVAFRNKKKANIEIARQKHLVEEKQREILDSIYYARRIQRALITNEKYIEKNLRKLRV